MEEEKFKKQDIEYFKYEKKFLKEKISSIEVLRQSTAYIGTVNLARTLSLYECYKKIMNLNGHIAEIGIWKGSSLLLFAKLVKIFEPYSNTVVHGFDNFLGMNPNDIEIRSIKKNSYKSNYSFLIKSIKDQSLDKIINIHKFDVTKKLNKFSMKYLSTSFKLVFFDCGTYEVVKSALPFFWERLLPGGIMIFDQFNYESAFGETLAFKEIIENNRVYSNTWSRSPSGYVIKKSI